MNRIIALVNQKGGVSKTTSTANIGAIMAEEGKKVLLIDFDAQGNLSQILGLHGFKNTIYECLTGKASLKDTIIKTDFNFDVIPSNINLSNADTELLQYDNKELRLKELIQGIKSNYDYILIDCNPNLNLLTINALAASNSFMIPLEASILSVYGLNQLIKIVKLVQKTLNPGLKNDGVFLTKVVRTNINGDFENQLNEIFGDKLFKSKIHQNIDVVKSQIAGKPLNFFNKNCRAYNDYYSLTMEVINKWVQRKQM